MAEHTSELDELQAGNRRQLTSLLARPRYPVNFVRYFATGGIATILIVVGLIYSRMRDVDNLLNSAAAMRAGGHIAVYDVFTDITTIALLGCCLLVIYTCVVSLLLSHRVAGPMAALVDCIEQLKRGDYNLSRELRDKDELLPIHDALRDLSRVLQEQHSRRHEKSRHD